MSYELDYENDVKIDPDALDIEWLNQAELMHKYTRHAANMKKEMDEAKERLEIGKAQIEMEVRSDPSAYGLAKPTEAGIQSTILMQEKYHILSHLYNEAKFEYEISLAGVRAIDQKKTALENLVKLLAASYFAGPKSPRDLRQEHLESLDRKRQNTKVKITRGRR